MRLIRSPFKGGIAYEWQIGPFVLMVYYPRSPQQPRATRWRLRLWRDPYWNR